MKTLQEFKIILEEEKQDFTKFDALVRAGLANKAQLQRLHTILNKMSEDKPSFTNADRAIIQNMFTKMVDLLTNNPQIFKQARRSVSESSDGFETTSDFKLSKTGKKVKAHKFKFDKDGEAVGIPEEFEVEVVSEDASSIQPPFILLLKRTGVRLFPNNTKVAIYYNDKLKKEFAIPFIDMSTGYIQSEESIEEAVMDTLHKIVSGKSAQKVKFASGETRTVDHFTASALTQVHNALNDDNKKKFADMVHKSPAHFSKAADFAFSKTKK